MQPTTVETRSRELVQAMMSRSSPADEAGIQEACQKLRAELEQGRVRRGSVFDELVTLQAEAGTSGRMAQYRRLLGAGCGGMPIGDVDDALSMLLEVCSSFL